MTQTKQPPANPGRFTSAMWASFGEGRDAVCVRSTIRSLRNCFGTYTDYDIHIGEVTYIDLESTQVRENNYFNFLLHKKRALSAERELRCALVDDGDISLFAEDEPYLWFGYTEAQLERRSKGVLVPIDLGILVHEVILHPDASAQRLLDVREIVREAGLSPESVR